MANNNNNRQPGGGNNGNKNRQSFLAVLICILLSLICMALFSGALSSSNTREITYDRFLEIL